jgi:hypothetical protein
VRRCALDGLIAVNFLRACGEVLMKFGGGFVYLENPLYAKELTTLA